MKPIRSIVRALPLGMAAVFVAASPAAAHTGFESSDPADGSVVEHPVDVITLVFSGDAEPSGDRFTVLDPDGQIRQPSEVSSADSRTWELRFDPPITGGLVGVRWMVTARDAHPIDGSFSFTTPEAVAGTSSAPRVGSEPPPAARTDVVSRTESLEDFLETDAESVTRARRVGAAGRVLTVSGTLLGVGGLVFAATAMRGRRGDVRQVLFWVRRAGVVVVFGSFVELVAHVAVQNSGRWSAMWSLSALTAVAGSAFGLATAMRVFGGLALSSGARLDTVSAIDVADPVVAVREMVGGRAGSSTSVGDEGRVVDEPAPAGTAAEGLTHPDDHAWLPGVGSSGAALGAGAILIAYLFDGHTVTKGNRAVTGVVDVIHVAGGAVWAGGIAMLAVVLWRRHREDRDLRARQLALRFSVLASVASVVVGTAGLVLTVVVLDSPSELWSTEWGRILMAKIVLVGVAAAAGAYNHKVLIPLLDAEPDDPALAHRFRNVVSGELVVLVAVVVATAFLMGAST